MAQPEIAIVGAGIGGLTAAIALVRKGVCDDLRDEAGAGDARAP